MIDLAWTAPWLGLFLLLTGISHFMLPGYYDQLVPTWLSRPRHWVHASGVVELLVGAALLSRTGRLIGAWAATCMMILYVAGHASAWFEATDERPRWLDRPAGVAARVAVNLGYLAWALTITVQL